MKNDILIMLKHGDVACIWRTVKRPVAYAIAYGLAVLSSVVGKLYYNL